MKIDIKDIQAIKELRIETPEEGGIIVCTGGQGAGKSTALRAISKGAGGSVKGLQPRDNCQRGEMWFDEVKMTVHRGQTRVSKDELQVETLEGRLDISKLVEPQIKDPEAADEARLKALVLINGVTASPSDFYEAVGGKDAYDALGVEATDDPVLMASRVARALHAAARVDDKHAKESLARYNASKEAAKDIDTSAESDEETLSTAHADAVSARDAAVRQNKQAAEQGEAMADAQAQLAGFDEPDLEKERQTLAAMSEQLVSDITQLEAMQKEIAKIKTRIEEREQAIADFERHVQKLDEQKEAADKLRATLEATRIPVVPDEAMDELQKAVTATHDAVLQGQRVRDAKQQLAAGEDDLAASKESEKRAALLRDRAHKAESVLSDLLPDCPIRYLDSRCVVATDRSPHELYSDLSDGERARVAIEVAAGVLAQKERRGLIIAPQWMWEGWTESTRQMVLEKLQEHRLTLITAEARDGELSVEQYTPENDLPR